MAIMPFKVTVFVAIESPYATSC